MITVLWVSLLQAIVIVSTSEQCPGFKNGADEFTTASFHTSQKKSGKKTVYTKADVSWIPQEMLDELECYKFENTELHSKTENWDWKNTGATLKGNKWTVNIKPCLQYQFMIILASKNGQSITNEKHELSKKVGPATEDKLRESEYLPKVPTNLSLTSTEQQINLSWTGSDCTTKYRVEYKRGKGEPWESKESDTQTQTTITNLKSCTEYEVAIAGYGPSVKEPDDKLKGSIKTKGCTDITSTHSGTDFSNSVSHSYPILACFFFIFRAIF